jgi:alpha-L-rhamnosidase
MNSFNHYAYGAIGEWLYTYVAGIKIDEKVPGYKHFMLAPHPGGGLTNANAAFKSIHGEIKSAWKIENQNMVYEVKVPANTTATVTLPSAQLEKVTVNAASLIDDKLMAAKQSGKTVSLKLGSGEYKFSYPVQ